MKSAILSLTSLLLLAACNNDNASKKEEMVKTDSLTAPIQPVTPVPDPSLNANAATPEPKCFQNDGLSYRTIINIRYFSAIDLSGTITVEDYNNKLVDKQRFLGSAKGNEISIRFMSKTPPVIGNATEWEAKPWIIKNTVGAESLSITVNAKNYDTNKWAETTYEFKPCSANIK